MILFNYWHFIVFGIIFLMFIGGIVAALKQENMKMKLGMLFTTTLISVFLAVFSVLVVDKYTKQVKLYKMKNKRLLSIEQIVYTGIVRNTGNHEIGKVTFEIKLVNKGHARGYVKGSNFYKSSGFMDFFTGKDNMKSKPQSVTKEFVVARNLKPDEAQSFRVHFRYPPYFRSTSQFAKVWGH